ncbi:DUF2066 domain-containing protein [Endozoicomonas euniceicola]|uniref:DUF2066 domain-containing protein n=1 Tax=Endozoicomonas euniceicola TaxID=1234143 RepID=A0ABY6GVP4_9GAMM|nr:DUF2066 domain-containing protein [Endozoicomonas euniceicola]UYM16837.1 DUF2066 domain-containing protein [Endozoicomonas euniceicola]
MSLAVMACCVAKAKSNVAKAKSLKFSEKTTLWLPRQGLLLLACSLLFLLPQLSMASQVNDLYQVEVPVSGQDSDDRRQATFRAMSEVLVRVTGQRQTLSNPAVKRALQKATNYLQGYSYHRDEVDGQRQLMLVTQFNDKAITRLLRDNGLGIWGENRSTTLMWLAVDDGGRRQIQSSGKSTELSENIGQVFDHRALPLIFPVMDFDDNLTISAVDVWGLFSSKLTEASVRYGSESILGGRLSVSKTEKGERYNGRLVLLFRNQRYDASIEALSARGVALAMADLVGNTLSRHYAVTAGSSENPIMRIDGTGTTKAYAGAIAYVEGLTAVRNVMVKRVSGDQLELELTIDGTVAQLSDSIALERQLQKVEPNRQPVGGESYLHYRWRGR